jgi:hypothetical protein
LQAVRFDLSYTKLSQPRFFNSHLLHGQYGSGGDWRRRVLSDGERPPSHSLRLGELPDTADQRKVLSEHRRMAGLVASDHARAAVRAFLSRPDDADSDSEVPGGGTGAAPLRLNGSQDADKDDSDSDADDGGHQTLDIAANAAARHARCVPRAFCPASHPSGLARVQVWALAHPC